MFPLYQSSTGTFVASSGANVSQTDALLNILIELRAANAMALDAQNGNVTQTMDDYRSDVVNATSNPAI